MNLLDPVVLDVVSSKVSQLLIDLDTLNKAQVKSKSGGKNSKSSSSGGGMEEVAALASKVASLDGFADELPGLLLRLKTLAHVHQEVRSLYLSMCSVRVFVCVLCSCGNLRDC